MLTNILHTIALATSVCMSTPLYDQSKKLPKPNRVSNNLNINLLQGGADNTAYGIIPDTTTTFYARHYHIYENNYNMQVNHVVLMSKEINQIPNLPPNALNINQTQGVAQEIFYIRMEIAGALQNPNLRITKQYQISDNLFDGDNTAWYYGRYLQTTNDLSSYVNPDYGDTTNLIKKFAPDKTLNGGMTNALYNISGYVMKYDYQYEQLDYDDDSGSNRLYLGSYDKQINFTYGKANYYAIYMQPYLYEQNDQAQTKTQTDNITFATQGNWIQLQATQILGDTVQEVIDIPSVMFTVLGMPFTFISTAFNLTLFPSTPYELNISWLFLGIIAVIIFVFLIKLILSKVK